MNVCACLTAVEARKLAPHVPYSLALAAFHLFDAAKTMELVHDQDLEAVRVQFESNLPGKFSWSYREKGQADWHGSLTWLKSSHSNGSCCGGA